MKYKVGDIVLVDYQCIRAFERIIGFKDGGKEILISTELLYDFYYYDKTISRIESYDKKKGIMEEGAQILSKWTEEEIEVFLMLEK